MQSKQLPLGPWPEGQDTVSDIDSTVFQPSKLKAARLRNAVNVNIDNDGYPTKRAGLVNVVTAETEGKTVFSGAGLLLMQDGGKILRIIPESSTWVTEELVTGLSSSALIKFHEHDAQIFWTNGIVKGRITEEGVSKNWGMAIPPAPTLGYSAGSLPAGRYRVACVYIDSNGIMSGASEVSTITLDGTKNIAVTLASLDSNAVYLRIFASYANTPGLWFAKQVAINALPTIVTNVLTSGEPLSTQHLTGPMSGIEGISSWGGFLLIWKGKFLGHSLGNNYHLFDYKVNAVEQDWNIKGVGGLTTGPLFVATERGLYKYTGVPGASDYRRQQIDTRKYAAGFAFLDGSKIGALQNIMDSVVAFASEDGLVLGLSNGDVVFPIQGRTKWDVYNRRATIVQNEQGALKQILTTLC